MHRITAREKTALAQKLDGIRFQLSHDAGRLAVFHTEHDKERRIAGKLDNLAIELQTIVGELYESASTGS